MKTMNQLLDEIKKTIEKQQQPIKKKPSKK